MRPSKTFGGYQSNARSRRAPLAGDMKILAPTSGNLTNDNEDGSDYENGRQEDWNAIDEFIPLWPSIAHNAAQVQQKDGDAHDRR